MVDDFADGQQLAMKSLERIAAMLGASAQDVITPLRITVRDLKTSFESLVNEQKSLGYDDSQGITAELNVASSAVERIIHEDLSWVADGDASKMLMSLLTMRRDEMAYRLTRRARSEKHFLDEVRNFNALFDSVDGAPSMKQKLNEEVKTYSFAFAQWVASTDNIEPLMTLIGHDTETVLPEADKIIAAARDSCERCRHGAGGVAGAHPQLHPLDRPGGGADRHQLQLAHRPLDHAAAGRPGAGDEAARRRRYLGANSGNQSP